jgi:hypothetical protein
MSFLKQIELDGILNKMTNDLSTLGKIYKAKKSKFLFKKC